MRLNYYKAKVIEVLNRTVKVKSQLAAFDTFIPPLLDGILKLPVPQVDDFVMVIVADPLNQVERYIHTDYVASVLTDTATDCLIENNNGGIKVESADIQLGAEATEYVALSAQVKTQLDNIQTAITTLVSNFNSHSHLDPVSGALPPPTTSSSASYTAAEVAATKVKAE